MTETGRAKRVLVTGAGSGIGLSVATRFAEDGYRLGLLDSNEATLADAERELSGRTEIATVQGDVTDPATATRAVASMVDRFGGIDCLVTSAGIVRVEPALEVVPDQFLKTLQVNVLGTFLLAQAAARVMASHRSGSIIMIGSVYGLHGAPNRTAYCASKGAVHLMVESLAVEWGPLGIRVNAVAPTGVRTPMVRQLIESGKYDMQGVRARTPLGRLAEPSEVAAACAFLASEQASMTTGHILRVDGGWISNGYTSSTTMLP